MSIKLELLYTVLLSVIVLRKFCFTRAVGPKIFLGKESSTIDRISDFTESN